MGVMVQIRDVPEEIHRKLKARAAEAGLSLSEYLLRGVAASAARPTQSEWLARLRRRTPVKSDIDVVDVIREGRKEREAQLMEALGFSDRR